MTYPLKFLGYSARICDGWCDKLQKCDEWYGCFANLYYFCQQYGQRSQRNCKHSYRQYCFHDTGDSHLQALRTRGRAMAVLYSSAMPFCIRLIQLLHNRGHPAVHPTHAPLIRQRRQLYHQSQPALPAYKHPFSGTFHLSVSPLCDEQSCRE